MATLTKATDPSYGYYLDGSGQHVRADLAGCMDCGLAYGKFLLDMTLPDDQWQLITGQTEGLLCAACIVKRAARIPGIVGLRLQLDIR